MRKTLFRITAKAYIMITFSLLLSIMIAGLVSRIIIPETQLIFAINKELQKETSAYEIAFEFKTLGDAVLYKDKHLKINTTVSRDLVKYHLTGFIQSKLIVFPKLEAFFSKNEMYIKVPFTHNFQTIDYDDLCVINQNKTLSLTHLIKLLDFNDPELLDIFYRNLFKIKTIFKENIEVNNNEVAFTITLDEAFDKADSIILLLSEEEAFSKQITSRYSKLYNEFGQHAIWDETTITSMILFNEMVALNNDFYTTINDHLIFFKKQLDHFKGDSLITISFTFNKFTIETISMIGQFDYKKFDANENISLSIIPVEYKNIPLPNGDISSLKPTIVQFYESLKTERK